MVAEQPCQKGLGLDEEQLAALEARGLEVCVQSEGVVDALWLVPRYGDGGRTEMTFRDASTLAKLCAAFPGTRITRFEVHPPDGGDDSA